MQQAYTMSLFNSKACLCNVVQAVWEGSDVKIMIKTSPADKINFMNKL